MTSEWRTFECQCILTEKILRNWRTWITFKLLFYRVGIVKAKMDILIHMTSSHPCPHFNYCSTGHLSFHLWLLNINLNEVVPREEENVCLAQFWRIFRRGNFPPFRETQGFIHAWSFAEAQCSSPPLFLSCLGINKGSKRTAVGSTKRMQTLDTEFPGSFLNIPQEWILSCCVPAWML